jgi:hypothetical protein
MVLYIPLVRMALGNLAGDWLVPAANIPEMITPVPDVNIAINRMIP